MGWDGMGWDGMGWDGIGWDGMGQDRIRQDKIRDWASDRQTKEARFAKQKCLKYCACCIENCSFFFLIGLYKVVISWLNCGA